MIRVAAGLATILALLAAGCVRRGPAPVAAPHYVVGGGYQASSLWFYPREDFHYDATGLATVLPDRRGLTADGEAADGTAMTGAHQTLQLPAIVRVTNLDTGAQVLVRINDRGPETPKRLIGLSRRAAELLGVPAGAATPVRVQVEEAMSLALREQMQGGPRLSVSAAPRGTVQSESLAPPPGIGQSSRGRIAASPAAASASAPPAATVPDRLPETVQRGLPAPGRLLIRAGSFGRMDYARQVAAKLTGIGASVDRVREGRTEQYRVTAGPFLGVDAADKALDQALRAGVTDARIVVE